MMKLPISIAIAMTAAACTSPEDSWKPVARDAEYTACRVDDSPPGGRDYVETRTFDARGNIARRHFQWMNDSVVDQQVDFTYDGDRWTTATTLGRGGVETAFERQTVESTDGDVVLYELDNRPGPPDGTIDYAVHYTFGDDGRVARADFDGNGDGTTEPDHYQLYDWDTYGCPATVEIYAPSGRERISYKVNPKCNVTEADYDVGADGTIDQTETIDYDTTDTLPINDYALDGKIYHYTYDDQRRVAMVENGTDIWTYTYDCAP